MEESINNVIGEINCPSCGAKISLDSAFCPKCGAKVTKEKAKTHSEFQTREGLATLRNFLISKIVITIGAIILLAEAIVLGVLIYFHSSALDNFMETNGVTIAIVFGSTMLFMIGVGIFNFVIKGKLSKVNEYFNVAFKAQVKSIAAGAANSVFQSVVKNGVAKNVADSATSIYQTYQAYKGLKNELEGFALEVNCVDEEMSKKKDKVFKNYIIVGIISILPILGSIFLIAFGCNQMNDVYFYSGVAVASLGLIIAIAGEYIPLKYELDVLKVFKNNQD